MPFIFIFLLEIEKKVLKNKFIVGLLSLTAIAIAGCDSPITPNPTMPEIEMPLGWTLGKYTNIINDESHALVAFSLYYYEFVPVE